jgi:hypothetical protein
MSADDPLDDTERTAPPLFCEEHRVAIAFAPEEMARTEVPAEMECTALEHAPGTCAGACGPFVEPDEVETFCRDLRPGLVRWVCGLWARLSTALLRALALPSPSTP